MKLYLSLMRVVVPLYISLNRMSTLSNTLHTDIQSNTIRNGTERNGTERNGTERNECAPCSKVSFASRIIGLDPDA